MTRDDVLRMAHEADEYADRVLSPGEFHPDKHDVRDLHFAALVASAEREACAKVCEEQLIYFTPIPCPDKISGCLVDHHGPVQRKKTATECAAAIRARGE